jgi:hypothetical protein
VSVLADYRKNATATDDRSLQKNKEQGTVQLGKMFSVVSGCNRTRRAHKFEVRLPSPPRLRSSSFGAVAP